MKSLIDSFWRAAAYCLHPKVIGLSLLPLAIGVALCLGLGWLYWETAVATVRSQLESWLLVDAALKWVESTVGASFRAVLAPLLVLLLAAPVVVVLSVLLVAVLMTPAIVQLVADRRFPSLERKRGAGFFASVLWSLTCTVAALLLLVLSLPLWLIPPLVLVIPPLIWGWLTYRVMAFDTLAGHASKAERHQLMREHRLPLLGIGVVAGFLGAAPSLLWAFSVLSVIFAPFVIALSVWLYTLVFAFSALWFAHYGLAALAQLRAEAAVQPAPGVPATGGMRAGAAGEVIDVTPLPAGGGVPAVASLPPPPPGSTSGAAVPPAP